VAETNGFDREFGRIDGILADMRQTSRPILKMLSETAETSSLPDEDRLAAEETQMAAEIPERRAAEAALARLVSGLAEDIALRKTEFDNREQPTRGEALIGYLSKAAMRRRVEARAASPAALRHLEKLLDRGDALAGLLAGERDVLVEERKEGESDLGTFIDRRAEITQSLRGEDGETMSGVEAAAKMARVASTFDRFIGELNLRINACNVLRHKLMADIEDLLILYQVVFDASRRNDSVSFEPERFPHLTPEIERFARHMLTIRGLNARRQRADQAFMEFFSIPAAGENAPAQQDERKPAKAAGPRLSRR